eukprot:scaffold38678_cov33-Phaeocystis_antarctica.AAC.1
MSSRASAIVAASCVGKGRRGPPTSRSATMAERAGMPMSVCMLEPRRSEATLGSILRLGRGRGRGKLRVRVSSGWVRPRLNNWTTTRLLAGSMPLLALACWEWRWEWR